jgi:hypothetical protein
MSTPTPDENQSMRDALQRDAARVPTPDFDSALHHSTMRRLRSLAETPTRPFFLSPAFAAAAAMLALAASLAVWQMRSTPEQPVANHPHQQEHSPISPAPQPTLPRSSLLAYQTAADQSDEALFALLDRDSRELLPASSPVFSTLPH